MGRTIIIGDPHGCLRELEELLDKCDARPEDHVILVGDLVDRGPDSAGCVDLALRLEARQGKPACILGNHEERHLFYDDIELRKGSVRVDIPTHVETRKQLKRHHYDYFRRMPLFIRLPEHNAVVVHAGVFPGRPIEKQSARHLLHIQSIRPPEEKSMWLSRVPPGEVGWRFWHHFWDGPERVIFGHSVLNKPLITDRVVGIDGGCCFGREMWAFILPDNQLVSVSGRGSHDPGDPKRRGNHDSRLYMIDDQHGVGTF
jgi:hypothetical protein